LSAYVICVHMFKIGVSVEMTTLDGFFFPLYTSLWHRYSCRFYILKTKRLYIPLSQILYVSYLTIFDILLEMVSLCFRCLKYKMCIYYHASNNFQRTRWIQIIRQVWKVLLDYFTLINSLIINRYRVDPIFYRKPHSIMKENCSIFSWFLNLIQKINK